MSQVQVKRPAKKEILSAAVQGNRGVSRLAQLFHVGPSTVVRWLSEHGLTPKGLAAARLHARRQETHGKKVPTADPTPAELKKLYVKDKLSACQVAKLVGRTVVTVTRMLRRAGVDVRSTAEQRVVHSSKVKSDIGVTDAVLRRMYLKEKRTASEIAAEFKLRPAQIYRWLASAGIFRPREKPNLDKKAVKSLLKEGLSAVEVGRRLGTSGPTVRKYARANGLGDLLPTRVKS